jgi:hypothetical protein
MSKKIILLTLLIIVLTFCIFVYTQKYKPKHIISDGYLVSTWESLYFAKKSPEEGNSQSDKIWIKQTEKSEELMKNLEWKILNPETEFKYVQVNIEGKLYGPGGYGGVPGYGYEIEITDLNKI